MDEAKFIEIQSASDPNLKHIVILTPEGTIKCDCPGFAFRNKCRHVEEEGLADKIEKYGKSVEELYGKET